MSYGASIYGRDDKPPVRARVLFLASKDGDTIVNSAPSLLEIETQLVIDRLLRECFTRNRRAGTGRTDIL